MKVKDGIYPSLVKFNVYVKILLCCDLNSEYNGE